MKKLIIAIFVSCSCLAQADQQLEKRVAALEKEVAELRAAMGPMLEKAKLEQQMEAQRLKAKERMREDSKHFTRDELREIERLYQVANKKWQTQEGKDSLSVLVEKYDKANRVGCAFLYLGQMSKGQEREQYLKQAIENYSDCFYGDGVQVGAYARYYLASYYKSEGQDAKAKKLFEEIKSQYPDAIDHSGKPLSAVME